VILFLVTTAEAAQTGASPTVIILDRATVIDNDDEAEVVHDPVLALHDEIDDNNENLSSAVKFYEV
jgi:hypothetical protein